MKKWFSLFVLAVIIFSFVCVFGEEPSVGVGEEDVKKIENLTNKIPIDPDTGDFDPGRTGFNKSKAEERIEKINIWLSENASWLKLVFGMVPEVSFLFAINLFLWLWCFTYVFLNAIFTQFLFIDDEKKARFTGFLLFVILVVTNFIYSTALLIYKILFVFWTKIIPYGFLAALIVLFLVIILFFVLLIYFPQALLRIRLWMEKKRLEKAKKQQEFDQKVLRTQVKAMAGG